MPLAATCNAATSRARTLRRSGTTIPSAATTWPSTSTGTPTLHAPSVISSNVCAYPSRLIRCSCARIRPGSVTVYAVMRVSPCCSTSSCTSAGACASNTLPTPVECNGNLLPVELTKLIKAADRNAAYFEATRLAGFSESEAKRFFGTPPEVPASFERDYLHPWPAKDAQSRFLKRFAELVENE